MPKLNQTVLVIGGAGYIGSHIVLKLCEQGYDVTVFDNLSTGYKKNVDLRAQFIQGDILNQNDLSNLVEEDQRKIIASSNDVSTSTEKHSVESFEDLHIEKMAENEELDIDEVEDRQKPMRKY